MKTIIKEIKEFLLILLIMWLISAIVFYGSRWFVNLEIIKNWYNS
jgi:hypothetical protein